VKGQYAWLFISGILALGALDYSGFITGQSYKALVWGANSCADGDNGDVGVAGVVTVVPNSGIAQTFDDSCQNSNLLHEFNCEGSTLVEVVQSCRRATGDSDSRCRAGRCVS
jgi:hypothetical protein